MRNFYASPELKLLLFQAEDVIRTSGEGPGATAENDFSDPFTKGGFVQ